MPTTDATHPSQAGTPLELLGAHPGLSVVDPGTILTRLWYFDGKFLRAAGFRLDQEYVRSLVALSNQATGSGVVHGLDVTRAGGDRLRVQAGLALAPTGRVLYLPQRVELSIAELIARSTGTFDPASPPVPGTPDFTRCPPDQPTEPDVTLPARPLYVLTVSGIEALCGEEERFGQLCQDACATETDRSKVVEGVCFRVRELRLALPTSTAVPFGTEHLRSRVASAYFELERTAVPSMISAAGLRNPVWCAAAEGIGGEELALAVLDRTGAVTSFVDTWTARRELVETTPRRYWAWRTSMRPWDVFLAQLLQFQCQLLDLGTDGDSGGRTDQCAPERDALVAVQEMLTDLPAEPAGADNASSADVLKRIDALRTRITTVLASERRPASGSLLIDGGIVQVPPAGYLPTSLATDVTEQVRALFGPGVDLRFCAVRPDYIPEALLQAQHMERISLTRGLDNPAQREEVDILIPGGEIVTTPHPTPHTTFTGTVRILPEVQIEPGVGTSVLTLSVVARGSTAVGWSWTLVGYGEAPPQLSVTQLLDAIVLIAQGEDHPELRPQSDRGQDARREDSFILQLLTEARNATEGTPHQPLNDKAGQPVAIWLDLETAVRLDALDRGGYSDANLRVCIYSRANENFQADTDPLVADIRLNGTLRVVEVSNSGTRRTIRTTLEVGVADMFSYGRSNPMQVPPIGLTWTVDVAPTGGQALGVGTDGPIPGYAVFTKGANPRDIVGTVLLRETHPDTINVDLPPPGPIGTILHEVQSESESPAADSKFPAAPGRWRRVATLELKEEGNALAPGSTGRTIADSVIAIIHAKLASAGGDPAFATYATHRLRGAPTGNTASQIRATTDWVLFHRRRTRICAEDTDEQPLRTRTYRLFHHKLADGDENVTVENLEFEPVATLAFPQGQVVLQTPTSLLRASWQATDDRGSQLRLALVGDLGPGDGETVALGRLATVRSLLADLIDVSDADVEYLRKIPPQFQQEGLDGVMFTIGFDEVTQACMTVYQIAYDPDGTVLSRWNQNETLGSILAQIPIGHQNSTAWFDNHEVAADTILPSWQNYYGKCVLGFSSTASDDERQVWRARARNYLESTGGTLDRSIGEREVKLEGDCGATFLIIAQFFH